MDEKYLSKLTQQYEYFLNNISYTTEEALHDADPKGCLVGEHDWKKSYAYRKYSCKKCEAIRMKTN